MSPYLGDARYGDVFRRGRRRLPVCAARCCENGARAGFMGRGRQAINLGSISTCPRARGRIPIRRHRCRRVHLFIIRDGVPSATTNHEILISFDIYWGRPVSHFCPPTSHPRREISSESDGFFFAGHDCQRKTIPR